MTKIDMYRGILRNLGDWEPYLLNQSGLPGPRGNIELAEAAAEEGNLEQFDHWITYNAKRAPTNTPEEFLAFCGVLGLGKLVAQGKVDQLKRLKSYANDPRWRVRESVAMALQRVGTQDMKLVLSTVQGWSTGTWLEKRAVVAALAEPKLLKTDEFAGEILDIFDKITEAMLNSKNRKDKDFKVLRQALGYAWSVVVVAFPKDGKLLFKKWCMFPDNDIKGIMKENLKKNRLARMDSGWVEKMGLLIQSHDLPAQKR